jgi:hypothetical protein
VAACGRVGFDARASGDATGLTDGARGSDAGADGLMVVPDAFDPVRCGVGTTAPDPLTLAGEVVYFTNFTGSDEPIGSAAVGFASPGGAQLATTTSDGSGGFSVSLPTGGTPISPIITLSKVGYFDITVYDDLPLDASTAVAQPPIIDGGAMGSVYSAGTVTRDTSKGTIAVFAHDCAGSAITGVTIAITPAPEKLGYADINGQPTGSATALPSGNVAAYNAVPSASTEIDVSRDGVLQFQLTNILVEGSDSETVVDLHLPDSSQGP